MTLVQRVQLAGAVIVSTPQELALADVRRGVAMFEKTHAPILGVIENMAYFEDATGVRTYIFGEGGARRTAEEIGAPFLGEIPIDVRLRESGDNGAPLVATQPGHPISQRFAQIAAETLANVARVDKPAPKVGFDLISMASRRSPRARASATSARNAVKSASSRQRMGRRGL